MKVKTIEAAKTRNHRAALNLIRVIKKEFPVGRRLTARLGRHKLKLQVVSVGSYWGANPGKIYGANVQTGKIRKFTTADVIQRY